MRQAGACHDIGAAHIDSEHQVEALQRQFFRSLEHDRAGIVDQDVEAAEMLHRLFDRALDRLLIPHIHADRQRPTPSGLDFLGRGMDRAG